MHATCSWCVGESDDNPEGLCEDHEAEYEGVSVYELRRMHKEQAEELL